MKPRAVQAPRTLLLDIGNTRLKWALVHTHRLRLSSLTVRGALPTRQLSSDARSLKRVLRGVGADGAILVCNVAGPAIERRLRSLARDCGAPRPRFLRTSRSAGGVRNAYHEPWRLGVDRWASLIGARAEFPDRAICLVAVGTAMTVDLLDASGRHRGGIILPSPGLMIEGLLGRTAGIRRRAGGRSALEAAQYSMVRPGVLFARSTRDAVAGGALHAAAAVIRESMQAGRALLGEAPLLVVAGGGAPAVIRLLRIAHRRRDDLALRGLAVLESATAQFA